MPSVVPVPTAAREIIGRLRTHAKVAARTNDVISVGEQEDLSPWGQSNIKKLRKDRGGRLTVDDLVDTLAPKVQRALKSVAENGMLTAASADKLIVPELKAHVTRLLGDVVVPSASGMEGLSTAVTAAGTVQALTDYNRTFSLETYRKGTSVADILARVYDVSPSDIDAYDLFSRTTGRAGVDSFTLELLSDAEEDEASGSDLQDALTHEEMANATRAVAAAALGAFTPISQFRQVLHAHHGIAEDGDLQVEALLAQKKNGSWVALTYTNFPF